MKSVYYLLLFLPFNFFSTNCFSQVNSDTVNAGSVRGIVWDAEHNAVLRAATIAIYTAKDTALIGYRLTNNYGEFEYKGLPLGVKLKVVASYMGYQTAEKIIMPDASKKEIDIGHLDLPFIANQLKEVVIRSTLPPVQMKGDTLEFNADAFKLNPNAQTEDLLRVLPGITLWADGTITVNGRDVKSVLVNGKPFFGDEARVATQNIPKSIVEKIQVYQKDKDPRKLTDSTAELNIKLKKGMGYGHFGKFDGGYGTDGKFEGDANLNFFNSRTQLGVAVSGNNLNKVANDISVILKNNTFKGPGANIDYQSDFDIVGLNNFKAGGLLFQHNFIPNPDHYNDNRLTADFFLRNNKQYLSQETETINTINGQLYFKQLNKADNNNTEDNQKATSTYLKLSNGNRLLIETDYKYESTKGENNEKTEMLNQDNQQLSVNDMFSTLSNNLKTIDVKTNYSHGAINNDRSWLSKYEINYKFGVSDQNSENNYRSNYTFFANNNQNINFDRLYKSGSNIISNTVAFKLPNFGALFFGDYKFDGIATGLKNTIKLNTNKVSDDVLDKDSLTNDYQYNPYLTNNRTETIWDMKPALTLTKSVNSSLSNRFERTFLATADIGAQLYHLNSSSQTLQQNFIKSYWKFMPAATVYFSNRKFGEFINSFNFQLNTYSTYPTVQQLAPLVDSINVNYIQKGNLNLKEEDFRELSFNFRHVNESSTNIFSLNVYVKAGYIENYFTNNSSIDSLGRTVFTIVNASGYRFLNSSAELKKAYKWNNNQLQLSFTPAFAITRAPNYINSDLNYYKNISLTVNPRVDYAYKDVITAFFYHKQNWNHYNQDRAMSYNLSNIISQSTISLSVNVTPKFTISSNATYTKNSYNDVTVKNFTIWNGALNYKLFKDDRAAIKFSAFDILHQNTGITNYGFNNSITQGSVNILQQYFMLTLAYFPRKFGK